MKKLLSGLIFVILIISFVYSTNVFASPEYQATMTATRDIRTPPGSPTAGGASGVDLFPTVTPISVECNEAGLPSNWGSLTPDPSWLLICGECLPSVTPIATIGEGFPMPSASPTFCEQFPLTEGCNTQTPTPVYTATATGTPTVTPVSNCVVPNTVTALPSTATVTPSSTSTTIDDPVTSIGGTCSHNAASGAYLDTLTLCVNDSGVSYSFTGSGVTLYSRRGNLRGIGAVYIDGVFITNTDLYNASLQETFQVYTNASLSYGFHTVELRWTGTKNAASSAYGINIDKIIYNHLVPTPTSIGNSLIDCASSGLSYTCITDNANYAALKWDGVAPGEGGDREIEFELSPQNKQTQITYKITIVHREISGSCANIVSDIVSIEHGAEEDPILELESGAGCDVTAELVLYGYHTVSTGVGNSLDFYMDTATGGSILEGSTLYFLVEVWTYIQCQLGTATPSGTSTPSSGYCQSIPVPVDYTQIFDIVTTGRVTSCADLPYFSAIDLLGGLYTFISWALPDSIDDFINSIFFPASTICFYSVEFETVSILGVSVSLVLFIDLAILIYILRHFLTK